MIGCVLFNRLWMPMFSSVEHFRSLGFSMDTWILKHSLSSWWCCLRLISLHVLLSLLSFNIVELFLGWDVSILFWVGWRLSLGWAWWLCIHIIGSLLPILVIVGRLILLLGWNLLRSSFAGSTLSSNIVSWTWALGVLASSRVLLWGACLVIWLHARRFLTVVSFLGGSVSACIGTVRNALLILASWWVIYVRLLANLVVLPALESTSLTLCRVMVLMMVMVIVLPIVDISFCVQPWSLVLLLLAVVSVLLGMAWLLSVVCSMLTAWMLLVIVITWRGTPTVLTRTRSGCVNLIAIVGDLSIVVLLSVVDLVLMEISISILESARPSCSTVTLVRLSSVKTLRWIWAIVATMVVVGLTAGLVLILVASRHCLCTTFAVGATTLGTLTLVKHGSISFLIIGCCLLSSAQVFPVRWTSNSWRLAWATIVFSVLSITVHIASWFLLAIRHLMLLLVFHRIISLINSLLLHTWVIGVLASSASPRHEVTWSLSVVFIRLISLWLTTSIRLLVWLLGIIGLLIRGLLLALLVGVLLLTLLRWIGWSVAREPIWWGPTSLMLGVKLIVILLLLLLLGNVVFLIPDWLELLLLISLSLVCCSSLTLKGLLRRSHMLLRLWQSLWWRLLNVVYRAIGSSFGTFLCILVVLLLTVVLVVAWLIPLWMIIWIIFFIRLGRVVALVVLRLLWCDGQSIRHAPRDTSSVLAVLRCAFDLVYQVLRLDSLKRAVVIAAWCWRSILLVDFLRLVNRLSRLHLFIFCRWGCLDIFWLFLFLIFVLFRFNFGLDNFYWLNRAFGDHNIFLSLRLVRFWRLIFLLSWLLIIVLLANFGVFWGLLSGTELSFLLQFFLSLSFLFFSYASLFSLQLPFFTLLFFLD